MGKSANNTAKVTVLCRGITPILMNPATEEVLKTLPGYGLSAGAKKKKEETPPEDTAAGKIIRCADTGQIGIPVEYLYSCLVNAGRSVTYSGKKNISTAESSLVPSFLLINNGFLPFVNQDSGWAVDMRRGVNKSTKGAMCVIRPKFKEWEFGVDIEVDTGEIDVDKVKTLFEVAGKKVGLGDFRPAKKGQFGRFEVVGWNVLAD